MGLIQEFVKRPMDVLEEHISAGTATFQTAWLCLQAESKHCLASSATTVGDVMRSSNTASIILDWLWASHAETLGDLVEQSRFFRLLVLFLVAEKQHDRIWSWLQIVQSNLDTAPPRQLRNSISRTYNKLLFAFVKSEVSLGNGLDAATGIFVRAVNEGQQIPAEQYVPAAWYLTRLLMGVQKPAQLKYTTIRAFMEATGTSRKPNTLMSLCHWVHLAETPDLTVASRYFESLQPGKPSTKQHSTVSLMALKAAKFYFEKGRRWNVSWDVADLQKNFRYEVEDSAPIGNHLWRGSPHTVEENSLRLLGELAVH